MKEFKICWAKISPKSGNTQIKFLHESAGTVTPFGVEQGEKITYYKWVKSTPLKAGDTLSIDPSKWKTWTKEVVIQTKDGPVNRTLKMMGGML